MVESSTVLAFVAVAALAYVTPGPDWFVVMRHAATSRRHGWVAALFVLGVRALRTLTDAGRSRAIVDRVSGVALIGLGGLLVTAGRSE